MTNDEILNTFANKMLSAVEGIEAFGKEQIPDYIEQVLLFNFWEDAFYIAIPLVLLYVFYRFFKKTEFSKAEFDYMGAPENRTAFRVYISSVILAVVSIWSVIAVLSLSPEMVKIKIAPKVYIVDYLRARI